MKDFLSNNLKIIFFIFSCNIYTIIAIAKQNIFANNI